MSYRILIPALALLLLPVAEARPAAPPAGATVSPAQDQDPAAKKPVRARREDLTRRAGDARRGAEGDQDRKQEPKKGADDDAQKGRQGTDGDTPPRPAPKPAPAAGVTTDALRAAFAQEYFTKKDRATADLAAAREELGGDPDALAARRTEIARLYRGELAQLRTAYAAKAKAAGLDLALPADASQLEAVAAQAAPETALRSAFATQVASLTASAQAELAIARRTSGGDRAAFAAKRTEIARKYRGQAMQLQRQFAQRAAGAGIALDTTPVNKALAAIAATDDATAAAPAKPAVPPSDAGAPRDAAAKKDADAAQDADAAGSDAAQKGGADGGKPQPVAGRPLDPVQLRAAFGKQVDTLRTAAAGELATAEGSLTGDALVAKRVEIARRYRGQLGRIRGLFAERAAAAGVALPLPTDAELVPELTSLDDAAKPAEKRDGTPPPADGTDGAKPEKAPEKKPADGEKPAEKPKEGEKKIRPSEKRGRGPRWGGGGR